MSLCYNPKNTIKPHSESQYDHGGWDVNSLGAELLGGLHEQLELPMCNANTGRPPRVLYSMDEETALATAKKLSKISDDDIKFTFEKYAYCWEKTATAVDDYLQWVRDWQKFLEVCGGYDTD